MKKLILIVLSGWLLLFPLIAGAGEYKADGQTVTYEGLVPCGKPVNVGESEQVIPCQLCHLFVMAKGIIDFLLLPPDGVIFLVAILMIVVSGVMFIIAYVLSPDNPSLISKAQKTITATIIGLVIMFSAWIFVNTFFLLIGVADWTGLRGGWFIIDCDINLPETYLPQPGNLALKRNDQFPKAPITASIDQDFDLNIGFSPNSPVSNIDISLSFDNSFLNLKNIIPNTANSNFKTFLPLNKNLEFDKETLITKANTSGNIVLSATCLDLETGESKKQTGPVNSLATLVFEAKKPGQTKIEFNAKDSRLIAAIGKIADVFELEDNIIKIIIK